MKMSDNFDFESFFYNFVNIYRFSLFKLRVDKSCVLRDDFWVLHACRMIPVFQVRVQQLHPDWASWSDLKLQSEILKLIEKCEHDAEQKLEEDAESDFAYKKLDDEMQKAMNIPSRLNYSLVKCPPKTKGSIVQTAIFILKRYIDHYTKIDQEPLYSVDDFRLR